MARKRVTDADLVPVFKAILKRAKGRENAVNSSTIADKLSRQYFETTDVSSGRIRRVIHFIRINQLIKNLIASNKGYYVETDPVKIRQYVNSLRSRALKINNVASCYSYEKVKP